MPALERHLHDPRADLRRPDQRSVGHRRGERDAARLQQGDEVGTDTRDMIAPASTSTRRNSRNAFRSGDESGRPPRCGCPLSPGARGLWDDGAAAPAVERRGGAGRRRPGTRHASRPAQPETPTEPADRAGEPAQQGQRRDRRPCSRAVERPSVAKAGHTGRRPCRGRGTASRSGRPAGPRDGQDDETCCQQQRREGEDRPAAVALDGRTPTCGEANAATRRPRVRPPTIPASGHPVLSATGPARIAGR